MYHRQVSSQPYPGVQYRRAPAPQAQSAAVALPRTDYTLAHAGRQLRLGPIAFWVVVGTLVIMAAWTITTATYFAFRDDVLTGLIARQAEMQYAYEDRIADLRQQIDRMSSRQLLNQEQYEQKLDQIMRRQSALENRANAIQTMPDGIVTGSTRPTGREQTRSVPNRPPPVNDKSSNLLLPERTAGRNTGVADALARLHASLDRVEARQAASLASMEETYEAKARRIRGVLADLGLDAARIGARDNSAVGGPLVPARLPAYAGNFEQHVYRVGMARAQVDRLTRTLASVPVRKPIMGELDSLIRLRRAHRSVHPRAGHAHRPGFPRRDRRSGARDRRRHCHRRRMARRLRQDGRDRPRQWPGDALRASLRHRRSRSASGCAPATSSARSDRPAARPDRICTMRRA